MLLTIAIPTIPERSEQFNALWHKIFKQISHTPLGAIDLIYSDKPKGDQSIGKKRDELYKASNGLYTVMIDDDDDVPEDYIETIFNTINHSNDTPDCIGYIERCIIDGVTRYSKISNEFQDWSNIQQGIFSYARTPFFKVPILTELCKKVGVSDMRFGEDHDFARRLKPHIKTHIFIDKVMYYYTANSLTPEQHKLRYGL